VVIGIVKNLVMRNSINPKTDSINTTTEEVHKALVLVVYSLLDD